MIVNDIFYSIGFAVVALFIICTVSYLFIYKTRKIGYKNDTYKAMMIVTVISILLEVLTATLLALKVNMILTNIIWKIYILVCFALSFIIFNYIVENNDNINYKKVKKFESLLAVIIFMVVVFTPLYFTKVPPYSFYGPMIYILYGFVGIGNIVLALLFALKKLKLRNVSSGIFIFESLLLFFLVIVQILSGVYFNFISNFFTIIVVYLFYSAESQDSLLVEEFSKIKDESDKKNEEKNNLIVNLSKEIRTPLSNIIGFSNLILLNKEDNNKKYTDSNLVYKECLQLVDIINNINNLSMFEEGKELLAEKEYNFDDLITSINNKVLNKYPDTKLSIRIMQNMPKRLYGDYEKILKLIELIIDDMSNNRLNKKLEILFNYKKLENNILQQRILFNLNNDSLEGSLLESKLEIKKSVLNEYNDMLNSSFKYTINLENTISSELIINQKILADEKVNSNNFITSNEQVNNNLSEMGVNDSAI